LVLFQLSTNPQPGDWARQVWLRIAEDTRMTTKVKPAPRLTASRKLELYLATRSPEAPVGEVLRQYGLHLDDLREIEQTIESAALAALKVQGRHGRLPTDVSPERLLQLEQELTEKTRALAELSVAFTVLEKKEREESQRALPAGRSRRRRAR
jgi:hypothetical protein